VLRDTVKVPLADVAVTEAFSLDGPRLAVEVVEATGHDTGVDALDADRAEVFC
jgi:hypothetical protein